MIGAVLAWVTFCGFYLGQAIFRETALWARMKQRFALWRQVHRDLRHATLGRKIEIEIFLTVLEAVLRGRGYLSYEAADLNVAARTIRAVRIIAAMPVAIAIEVIERTQIAREQIERARNAARR
jgi:hypothetical protein